jgi:hypothetical protein
MVPLQVLVVRQDLPGREAEGDRAQWVRRSIEQHRREPDAFASERAPQLQIRIISPKSDVDAPSRSRRRPDGHHIVLARRKQLPNLLDHLQNQRILAGPEADHNDRLRVLPQQPEYEPLEPPLHGWSWR